MRENGATAMADQANTQRAAIRDPVTCQYFPAIRVALTPMGPANYTVSGELCATKDELRDGTTVQLLIHGATYNRDYWNFGTVGGMRYSYSRDVAARGFPTFAMDELGAGNSSRPPSEQVTIQAAAFAAHQIVQALRNGSINGIQFGKVILVGHSLGSVVAWQESISFGDVDGVIVTGAAHALSSAFLDLMLFYPATNDPKFSDSGLDNGYLTTVPGIRRCRVL
jgi:pimeloyl-ACP methyl ester carboxylesterase